MLLPSGTASPDRILIQGSLFIQGCTFCKHAHLIFSERGHDGIERDIEQWFKSLQREGPGKGGTRKSRASKAGDWLEKTRKAWSRRRTGRSSGRAGPSGSTGAAGPICETKRTGPET